MFAMSSVTEGLGTSLLDAMACVEADRRDRGRRHPGSRRRRRHRLLVPPRDHAAMADAIVRLLKDAALRRRMGDAGLARARSAVHVERMVAGDDARSTSGGRHARAVERSLDRRNLHDRVDHVLTRLHLNWCAAFLGTYNVSPACTAYDVPPSMESPRISPRPIELAVEIVPPITIMPVPSLTMMKSALPVCASAPELFCGTS